MTKLISELVGDELYQYYPLSKNVYTFEHPATADKFQLFLEPVDKDAKGQYYRAVFNLLR